MNGLINISLSSLLILYYIHLYIYTLIWWEMTQINTPHDTPFLKYVIYINP
jgi:hypothetical protein